MRADDSSMYVITIAEKRATATPASSGATNLRINVRREISVTQQCRENESEREQKDAQLQHEYKFSSDRHVVKSQCGSQQGAHVIAFKWSERSQRTPSTH
jgi:hypothetical protein